MAIISHGSSYLMLSLKVLLVSTGVLSVAVMLKLSVPVVMEFTLSDLPSIWSFMASCLKPPYLYLVINCIIITIVASSKFQSQAAEPSTVPDTVVQVRPVGPEQEYIYGAISSVAKVPADLPTDYAVRPEQEYIYGAISSVAKVPADLPTDYAVRPEQEYIYGAISNVGKVPADLPTDYAVRPEQEYIYGAISSVAKVAADLPTDYAVRPEQEYIYGAISSVAKVPADLPTDYAVRPEQEYIFGAISSVAKVPADLPTDYAVRPEQEYIYGAISSVAKVPADLLTDYAEPEFGNGAISSVAKVPEYDVYGHVDAMISEAETTTTVNASDEMNGRDEIVISKSSLIPVRKEPMEHSVSTHKPPYSARFAHRKPVKVSPEGGKALGVSKPKRHETLETTWKTITDGRPMPLTRHLRKSDTWETNGGHHIPQPDEEENQKMAKSETFNDRSSAGRSNKSSLSPSPGSGKLRKEPSLSQDELNRQVEAFINKFNEDMRLQRQESLNQYQEMINRGAH